MGISDIDISLTNIWRSWKKFRRGKRKTPELEAFIYNLESHLLKIHRDLKNGTYHHGYYEKFEVKDNKRRNISVAPIRDRIVHRLIYDHLVPIFDKTFIYDVWSCRKNKGLEKAILRAQNFLRENQSSFVWRSDVVKFFDSVNHEILIKILERRLPEGHIRTLNTEIIQSFYVSEKRGGGGLKRFGIPIGNLTSQIFSNIYLNEFDRFVVHVLKPKCYLRYGDDFIIIHKSLSILQTIRQSAIRFLKTELDLSINPKNDILVKAKHGIHFLGMDIFPYGRRIQNRSIFRLISRFSLRNLASYKGMILKHGNYRLNKEFDWRILELVDKEVI